MSSHPQLSPIHHQVHEYADKISGNYFCRKPKHIMKFFIDGKKIYERSAEADPLYEDRYYQENSKLLSQNEQTTNYFRIKKA